jgi:hypothetical protein
LGSEEGKESDVKWAVLRMKQRKEFAVFEYSV